MDATASPSRRFARYEILRKLGRSMTDVYLAFDPDLKRKLILKRIEESNDDLTRLVIEAEKRGAQIQSELHRLDPRILEVYEYGVAEGSFFVTMEYFEGKNIAELLQIERRFDPHRAARYAAEVCNQLTLLHSFVSDVDGNQRAVVHGDIKPSNIQIGRERLGTGDDDVRLLDFGIAKVITYTRGLTRHNLGSPTYCSPERLAKGQVDAQSDLWAVGISLYEMVAGTPPYQAQDTRKLENLILSKRPPRALPENCPAALGAIISKALASETNRRYPTALDFEKDLRAFLDGKPTSEKKPSWSNNATINKFQPEVVAISSHDSEPRPVNLRPRRTNWLRLGSLLFGVLCVFFVSYLAGRIRDDYASLRSPAEYIHATPSQIERDWDQYQKLRQRDRFLGRLSPAFLRAQQMRTGLLAAANDIVDGFFDGSETDIAPVEWTRASACLRHVLEIDHDLGLNDSANNTAAGQLALCDGLANLVRNPHLPAAAKSEALFRRAAAAMSRSPQPHLALARLYIYTYQNVGRALAAFSQADRLGFHSGPRESEQQGDGFLLRAESALKLAAKTSAAEQQRWLHLASTDLDRAQNLYEPIAGFSNVSISLNRLDKDRLRAAQFSPTHATPKPKSRNAGRAYHYRRHRSR